MESLMKHWNGETLIVRYDRTTRAWIFIAIHSTQLGPAGGGTRIRSYFDIQAALKDVFRLAESMSYKFAVQDMPYGGGKAVIALPIDFDQNKRTPLLRRYGKLVQQLGGLFFTGPDMGTCSADMDIIAETGASYVFGCTPSCGGVGSSGPYTALGVLSGMEVACEHQFGEASPKGRRVLVQGTGSVGGALIESLNVAGAEVSFSDVDEKAIRHYRDKVGLNFVPADMVYETDCEVFSPCALGGVLNSESIPKLKCRVVAGGANNQFASPEDAERLWERGILCAPDYVINVGGAMALIGMEKERWTKNQAMNEIVDSVKRSLREIFALTASSDISPNAAARRVADKRLQLND